MSRFLVSTTGHAVPLSDGETHVGTDSAVQIPVRAEMGLLPRHFVIAPSGRGWQLATYEGAVVMVNGRQLSRTEIHDGDQILAGRLALTYRDELEAARVQVLPSEIHSVAVPQELQQSQTHNTFPSLLNRMPPVGEAERRPGLIQPLPPEEVTPPQTENERSFRFDEGPEVQESGPKKGGRWDHLGLIFLGLLLLGFGGVQVSKMLTAPKTKPVKATDLVFIKAEIVGGVQVLHKAGKVSFLEGTQGIEVVVLGQKKDAKAVWSDAPFYGELVFTSERREDLKHYWHSVLDLPKDLPFDPAWQEPGNVAKIGFLREDYSYESLMKRRWDLAMIVATLEVNGKSYRSIAQLNAARMAAESELLPFAGPGMIMLGLFLLFLGFEKWRTRGLERH